MKLIPFPQDTIEILTTFVSNTYLTKHEYYAMQEGKGKDDRV